MHASLGRGIRQLIESELLVAASKACQQQVKQVSMSTVSRRGIRQLIESELLVAAGKACQQQVKHCLGRGICQLLESKLLLAHRSSRPHTLVVEGRTQ
jgi:hypothetical protein